MSASKLTFSLGLEPDLFLLSFPFCKSTHLRKGKPGCVSMS